MTTTVISDEQLEQRLRTLPASAVLNHDDGIAVAALGNFDLADAQSRGRQSSPSPVRRFSIAAAALALVLVGVILANTAGVYFAPRYGRILADTPGIGPISGRMLSAVGLGAGDVTVFGESATSSGHTLKLEGGFADGLRMVLFVSIDGRGLSGNPKGYGMNPGDWGLDYDHFTLTDQFGHSYTPILVGGQTVVQFQPLAWPASEVGARLTFHETALEGLWDRTTHTVVGDWTLHATLVAGQAYTLPLPLPVRTANATYSFTEIAAAGRTLIVHVTITGPVTQEPAPTGPGGLDIFRPAVYDAAGNEMQLDDFGAEWPRELGGPIRGEMTAFIVGPGSYRITIAGQDRWIVVP